MASVNKVILIGNLGKDPESKSLDSGKQVTNFSIATTESWKDKSGKKQEKTEWHSIVAWGQPAEFAAAYLRKGQSVYVEGRLQTREWEKDGTKHWKTEVVVDTIRSLTPKSVGQNAPQADAEEAPF